MLNDILEEIKQKTGTRVKSSSPVVLATSLLLIPLGILISTLLMLLTSIVAITISPMVSIFLAYRSSESLLKATFSDNLNETNINRLSWAMTPVLYLPVFTLFIVTATAACALFTPVAAVHLSLKAALALNNKELHQQPEEVETAREVNNPSVILSPQERPRLWAEKMMTSNDHLDKNGQYSPAFFTQVNNDEPSSLSDDDIEHSSSVSDDENNDHNLRL